MHVVCLDLEGVLVPEIWIAFSRATGIDELKITTRDEPDYDKLMKFRIGVLARHGLKLQDIQCVIGTLDPLPGAKEFMSSLRAMTQVIILSDTFTQFAKPLMEKLAYPTLFCNSLEIGDDGSVTGYALRQKDGKKKSVEALKTLNFRVMAAGDSYNDLAMLRAADAAVLFKAPDGIKSANTDIPSMDAYEDLLAAAGNFVSGTTRGA